MTRKRTLFVGTGLIAAVAALGVGQQLLEQRASAQAKSAVQAPRFEVDPMWPKPLPNHWVMGNVIGVGVDMGLKRRTVDKRFGEAKRNVLRFHVLQQAEAEPARRHHVVETV